MAAIFNLEKVIKDTCLPLDAIHEIVGTFIDTITSRQEGMDQAIRSDDPDKVKRIAHAIKGGAGMCGAEMVFQQALVITASPLNKVDLKAEVENFKHEIHNFQRYMESFDWSEPLPNDLGSNLQHKGFCEYHVQGLAGHYCRICSDQADIGCPVAHESCRLRLLWKRAEKLTRRNIFTPLATPHALVDPISYLDLLLRDQKILIVEDEIVSLNLAKDILHNFRDHILIAPNGKIGLNQIEKHSDIGIVLLDLQTPELSGFEVLEHIHKVYGGVSPFGILIVSGISYTEIKRAVAMGAHTFLRKPYTSLDLLRKMIETLNLSAESRAQAQLVSS